MFTFPEPIDVLVVGSGHAGIEAASGSSAAGLSHSNVDTKSRYDRPDVV